MGFFGSKKGMEMTFPIIVGIVIGLVVIVVMIYIFTGKAKLMAQAGSCEDSLCSAKNDPPACDPGYTKSFTSCKISSGDTEKKGYCCIKNED